MKQSKVKFNLKEPNLLISRRNSLNDAMVDANLIRLNSNMPVLSESLIRKIELSRHTNQNNISTLNNSSSFPLLSKTLKEPQSILKNGLSNNNFSKKPKDNLNIKDTIDQVKLKKIKNLKIQDIDKNVSIKPINSHTVLNSFEIPIDGKQRLVNKLDTKKDSSDDSIFKRTSKIPVPKKNKKTTNDKKTSENSSTSSSLIANLDELYLPRTALNTNLNENLTSDFLLKDISATPTLDYYFPKILNIPKSNFSNDNNNSNGRIKLIKEDINSSMGLNTLDKNLLFNHFDSSRLQDFELNDEYFNDDFISNFNNSNFIRNNKLFYDSDLNLDKLLVDDFRKKLSQINEESSDHSSLMSRTKWSSSLSPLSNSGSNTTPRNNQIKSSSVTTKSTTKTINKAPRELLGRPLHKQINRTYAKLI